MPQVRPILALTVLAAGLVGCGSAGPAPEGAPPVGLVTSLPILWPEAADISELLDTDTPPHWALDVLAEVGPVRALDTLAGNGGKLGLPGDALLVLAQPGPFSPQENVALDDWVRAGGHVLLFADPMLTAESRFALGDRRRPQDMVLLSPILARWGLELEFDEAQRLGEQEALALAVGIPVNLPGRFVPEPGGTCKIGPGGLAADCRIGEGRAVLIADAAVLEPAQGRADKARRTRALRALLKVARSRD